MANFTQFYEDSKTDPGTASIQYNKEEGASRKYTSPIAIPNLQIILTQTAANAVFSWIKMKQEMVIKAIEFEALKTLLLTLKNCA